MASWGTPTTHTTGDTLAVSDWNTVANNETFLYQAAYARYYNSVATSLPAGTVTQVTLGGTGFSGYGFSVASNNAVVPIAGTYWAAWNVYCPGNTTAYQIALLYQNGAEIGAGTVAPGATTAGALAAGATLIKASANDTFGLYGQQGTGGALNTSAALASTSLAMAFVGSS